MINVLIVDDSEFARGMLRKMLETDPDIRVLGSVSNGHEAIQFIKDPPQGRKPDLVTMDIIMPGLDGFETTRLIMETHPLPIVIVTSSYNPQDLEKTFRAMEAGAVTILQKPDKIAFRNVKKMCKELTEIIKLMAEVKVVRRWPHNKKITSTETMSQENPQVPPTSVSPNKLCKIQVVAIGASTGGTIALQQILQILSPKIPVPVMVVQHIGGEFLDGMIMWLEKTTSFPIHLAQAGQKMQPGHVYLAPDDLHLAVQPNDIIELSPSEKIEGLRPSVSYLFQSVAKVYKENAIGVILTGMGKDGGRGLKAMRDAGAITIAQDKNTSVVFGMPAEAIKLGGVQYILPLKEIPIKINRLLGIEPKQDENLIMH